MDPIIGADTEAERDAATLRGLRILWRYVLPGLIIFAFVWFGMRWLLVPLLVGCAVTFLAWRFQSVPIVRVVLDLTWGAAVRAWDWAMISLSNMQRAAPERQTPTFARSMYAVPPPAPEPPRVDLKVKLAELARLPWIRLIGIGAVCVVVFLLMKPVVGFLTCPFGMCETKEEMRDTIAVDQVLDVERAKIGGIAERVSIERTETKLQTERGRDEIRRATPATEPPLDPELVRAWAAALDRLCVYPSEASGALPAGCPS